MCERECVCILWRKASFCCEKVCIDQIFMRRENEERDRERGQNRTIPPIQLSVYGSGQKEGKGKKGDDDEIVLRSGLLIHIHTFYLIMIFCFDSPSIIDFYSACVSFRRSQGQEGGSESVLM